MDIKCEDYEVINAYAGTDRSWHDRVTSMRQLNRGIKFSEFVVQIYLITAMYESKGEL